MIRARLETDASALSHSEITCARTADTVRGRSRTSSTSSISVTFSMGVPPRAPSSFVASPHIGTSGARFEPGSTCGEPVKKKLRRCVKVVLGLGSSPRPRPTMPLMPTSVVTGGAGFLGSHLCEHLLAEGHRVICVDNLDTGSLSNIEHIRDDAFAFVNHDVIAHIELPEAVDFVFHFASPASPIDYLRLPLHTLKVGAYGTHNALGLAKFKRARFVLA